MFEQLITAAAASTPLEWMAVIAAILQVLFALGNHKINFLFGIISVSIYVYLFIKNGLFADASLNLYYLIISIYGFVLWQKNSKQKKVSTCTSKQHIIALTIAVCSFLISYTVLSKFTTSTVPLQDSAVAAFAWSGSYLLTQRKIENWLWLNLSNAIAIPLYIKKQLILTAALTVLLFIIAIFGYIQWRRQLQQAT